MANMIADLERRLSDEGISYDVADGNIRIDLPNGFGTLEIGVLEDGGNIIGLEGYEWHTHGELLLYEGCESEEAAICDFIKGILDGRYLLIARTKNGVTIDKYVENDRQAVGKYIEPDEEEVICNEP